MAGNGRATRLDLRVVLPIAAFALVVFVIIFVELCGREDVEPLTERPDGGPTPTLGPTFTPGPSPTFAPGVTPGVPATVTGGRDRDVTRVTDLQALQDAIEQYLDTEDEVPSTDGAVQTLCVFEEFDAGCAIRDVLDPLPRDPLDQGYWYSSDGETYTIYARRETDSLPECDDHPAFLQDFDSLYCLSGPRPTLDPQPTP
ncbi:MAG: hypothetical protein WD939_00665 [Dehalococcoidia bacterium]